MKLLFVKGLLVMLFSGMVCNKSKPYLEDMLPVCGTSYETSELFFQEDDLLTLKLRFVYFADSLNEVQPNYDSVLTNINDFYDQANLEFEIEEIDTIIDSEIKQDMPSHIKYHLKYFQKDSVLTCYIYGNYQPSYPQDAQVLGSAGGIGATFFSIRKDYAYGITVNHELGHCFSLLHIDTPDDSNTGYTIYSGDKVCDTRGIKNLHEKVDSDCRFHGEETLSDTEKKVLVCNFMSWNYLHCRGCMTEGQIRKIRFYIHESPQLRACLK